VAALAWDSVGERVFQTGVDRGVLYLNDGRAFPWNGLTAVEENSSRESKSYYLDGVKFVDVVTPGDFSGRLKAFTYPDAFDLVTGVNNVRLGLAYYDQPGQTFNLSYRTRVGNDVAGTNFGYKIHLLFNLTANAEAVAFEALQDPLRPVEFSWQLLGTPQKARQGRPTVHISIDSTKVDLDVLEIIENILYGTANSNPRLPSIDELTDLFSTLGVLIVVDNGDGTWTAIDAANEYITMLDATTFQIDNADATYLDATTYQISTTNQQE
jgi:hypothetical protein